MKTTIYLPDDLGEMIAQHPDLNVSAVCQKALRQELAYREIAASKGEGMKQVKLYVEPPDGSDSRDVMFVGKQLARYGRGMKEYTAYLTANDRIAVHDGAAMSLSVYDDFSSFVGPADDFWWPAEFVAEVAAALDLEWTEVLDI